MTENCQMTNKVNGGSSRLITGEVIFTLFHQSEETRCDDGKVISKVRGAKGGYR